MMFCEVIPFFVFAGFPINSELPLSDAIADPAKAHVDGFGLFLFCGVIDDPFCTSVVGLDGCCRMGVSEKKKTLSKGASVLCIVKKSSHFSFGGRCHHIVHD